uniref:Receptor ligand binding region domain-containing protein n=1 Tax=Poecilia latipinna TaxID=48699 RepID=A0A3B3VXG9_9TELE
TYSLLRKGNIALARPLLVHSSINVAVVFSGSSYQSEVRGRLSGENFVDLPVVVSPVTVLVNDTNPRDLLTHLCDTMATEKLHGVVFEDDVGSEVAQILDFLSTQTALPIVGISGGSAVVIPYKVLSPATQAGSTADVVLKEHAEMVNIYGVFVFWCNM